MAPFDECSVLLPCSTLEDFPIGGAESDAKSLMAGWTVLWHPTLLKQTQQSPTWYRADTPPTPDGPRVIVVPDPSLKELPADYRRKCDTNPACLWVTGADRNEMLAVLGLADDDPSTAPIEHNGRTLAIDDFFAAGYLSLQIQIMTRRLRYTSNLDELYLQAKIVEAASAFCEREAEKAITAMHDVFDCLSEERDHYFSSDPHLIDLTLLTPTVFEQAAQSGWIERLVASATVDNKAASVLGTPRNVLIDGAVAQKLLENDTTQETAPDDHASPAERLRQALSDESIGWAGGGMQRDAAGVSTVCLDAMTMSAARSAFASGTDLAERAVGTAPTVFGQLAGMTPVDMISSLTSLGYRGVIPIDFSTGTGFGDESKVLLASGGHELEALTAKPIDAGSDLAFQSLGARLGEAIDSGEVATALLVHWPNRVSDSFRDLCRAATWSVALGKFWSLQRYFIDGERPYHNGSLDAVSKQSADQLIDAVSQNPTTTLASLAKGFCESVLAETTRITASIAAIAKPVLLDSFSPTDLAPDHARKMICDAVGVEESDVGATSTPSAESGVVLCFNPHGCGQRTTTTTVGGAPAKSDFVYATSEGQGGTDATFDVPATGFTKIAATETPPKAGLFKRLTGGKKHIAEDTLLRNEFMAVNLDETSGGIAGIYSASRGNRLSLRLVAASGLTGDDEGGQMIARRMQRVESNESRGIVECTGEMQNQSGKTIAQFTLRYRLDRGSRLLRLSGHIEPQTSAASDQPWKNYFAVRTAVADEAAILRPLVRDKVHSTSGRRMVAPLGVLIDESEKQTLVCGHGLPLHRKIGDRFLDTLIAVAQPAGSESSPAKSAGSGPATPIPFEITIALDSPAPVAIARSCVAPPLVIPAQPVSSGIAKTEQAWLVHVSSAETLVTDMRIARRADGKLAARLQLVQTRPKSARVKLQFCAFAHAAFLADASGIERPLDELPEDVRCNDGIVELTLGGHDAADLVVLFDL